MKKALKFIIAAVVILVIGIIILGSSKKEDTNKTEKSDEVKTANVVDEDFAEEYCQDAKFYGSTLNNYSLIDVWDYNKQFIESGSYDKDGNTIYMLRWNGKNKITDRRATFVCYISGSDQDHVTMHYLGIDDVALQGRHDFQGYTKDGQPEE